MSIEEQSKTLARRFSRSVERFPDRPALVFADDTLTYRQLYQRALALAATLQIMADAGGPPLTAVYAARSVTAFAGVLGALLSGNGYVPVGPDLPASYARSIIRSTGCRSIILDGFAMPRLAEVLRGIEQPIVAIIPHTADMSFLRMLWPMHTFIGAEELARAEQWKAPAIDLDATAHVMFTSGSTGVPKGVTASHRNIIHFMDVVVHDYDVDEEDRFLHIIDISFDLCLLDVWFAWAVGACLYCPSGDQRIDLPGYLRENRITVAVLVPSTGTLLKDAGALVPGAFPDLRHVWFCGEALLANLVTAVCDAAPDAVIVNFYGPTELTCACTAYRWDRQASIHECIDGIVPIGWAFPALSTLIVDPEMQEVSHGDIGDLLVTGPQLTQGYWNDPEQTAEAYVVPPGQQKIYYRTGDLVRRPANEHPMTFVGRRDHQVQILGFRAELGAIEAALRSAAEVDFAIAVGWPVTQSGADGVVGFVQRSGVDNSEINSRLRNCLPAFMVPQKVVALTEFPLNSNGKIDRKALIRILNEGSAGSAAT